MQLTAIHLLHCAIMKVRGTEPDGIIMQMYQVNVATGMDEC